MNKRIIIIVILGLISLMLTNCGTGYQLAHHTNRYHLSPHEGVLDLVPKNINPNPVPVSDSWETLIQMGPGSDAIVTLKDGTLRGGKIVTVTFDSIGLKTAGHVVTLSRSEIALVEVKGTSGALAGGLIGFFVGGIALTAILFGDEDVPVEGWILSTALLGIPTGLIGVLIGSQTGGDVEIVP